MHMSLIILKKINSLVKNVELFSLLIKQRFSLFRSVKTRETLVDADGEVSRTAKDARCAKINSI